MNYTTDKSIYLQNLLKYIVIPFFLLVIIIITYKSSLNYPFLFDDEPNIVHSHIIRHSTFKDLFFKNTRWICTWLNTILYKISKLDPFIYRVTNLCFHLITGIVIFFLIFLNLSNLKDKFYNTYAYWIALITSVIFLLHPVQTQTVCYIIQGQCEGLAALFVTTIALLFSILVNTKNYTKYLVLSLLILFTVLSCGTKEIAIISPAILLLIDWFFIAQGNFKELKSRFLVHLTILSIIIPIYFYLLKPEFFLKLLTFDLKTNNNIGNILTSSSGQYISPITYFISQFKVILHYITIFIWPFNLSTNYDWKLVDSFFCFDCIIYLIILVLISLYILKRLIKNKTDLVAFGLLWFFIAILPRSSIIASSELVADYKTYLASVGLIFIFSIYIVKIAKLTSNYLKKSSHALVSSMSLIILSIILSWSTYSRNKVWSSGECFWADALKNSPNSARAYNNYGKELAEKKQFKQAVKLFKKAIELDNLYIHAWVNLAFSYSREDKIDKAIEISYKSINSCPNCPEAYNNLGEYLRIKGNYLEAKKIVKKAIKLRPNYGKALYHMGLIQAYLNKKQKAYYYFKIACTKADYDKIDGFKTLAEISIDLKKFDKAIFAYKKILEFTPNSLNILNDLAYCYFENKNYTQAIEIYNYLLNNYNQSSYLFESLARCYLRSAQVNKALEFYKKAQDINPKNPIYYFKIAKCFKKLNLLDKSKKELNKLLALNTTDFFINKAKLKVENFNKEKTA